MFIRSLICLSACVCVFGARAVSLSRCDDGSFEVKNGHYGIHLSSSSGYAMTKASCGGAWFDLKGGFACALDTEPRVWRDAYMAKPEFEGQSQVENAEAEVLEESPSRILIAVRWELKKGVEVVQKLAFDDSARIGVEHTVTYPVPLHSVCYSLTSAGMVPERTQFFPENRHLPGAIHKPYCYAAPNWKFMSDGEQGVGLVAPDGNGWDRFEYASLIKTTRWAAANELTLHHAFMGHEKKGAAIMRFALVLTKDTAVAGKIARTMLAKTGLEQGDLFVGMLRPGTRPIVFSTEAQSVVDAGRALWKYYHAQKGANPDASFYDIRLHFRGKREKNAGRMQMNTGSDDPTYMKLLSGLRERHRLLARKIASKAYEYGFLKR